jgi:4,5-dihydroxyphthalate decarboxylase
MHTVVVRKELASNLEILQTLYKGFRDAKDTLEEQYTKGMIFNNMATMIPWFSKLIDEDRSLMGEDWWPYGLEANRKAVDAFLRYHFEQGLSKRRLTCEDIFAPELLGT